MVTPKSLCLKLHLEASVLCIEFLNKQAGLYLVEAARLKGHWGRGVGGFEAKTLGGIDALLKLHR